MIRIGRCALTERLGLGWGLGGGLFQAIHEGLRREVTVWLGGPLRSSAELDALRDRARALSRTSHPHLARVLDYGALDCGADAGRPYLVLERLVPRGVPRSDREAAGLAAAAAEGLEALAQLELGLELTADLRLLLGQGQDGRPVLVPGPLAPVALRTTLPALGELLITLLTGDLTPLRGVDLERRGGPGWYPPGQRMPLAVPAHRDRLPPELVELCDGCLHEAEGVTLGGVARALRDYERSGSRARGLTVWFLRGRRTGEVHALHAPGSLVLGSGRWPDSVLGLADPQLAPRHCQLGFDASGAAQVVDLGSAAGTWHDGVALPTSGSAPLRGGDQLRLGETLLEVQLWEGCPRPDPPLAPWWEAVALPAGETNPFGGADDRDDPFGPAPAPDPFGGLPRDPFAPPGGDPFADCEGDPFGPAPPPR